MTTDFSHIVLCCIFPLQYRCIVHIKDIMNVHLSVFVVVLGVLSFLINGDIKNNTAAHKTHEKDALNDTKRERGSILHFSDVIFSL